ncbi:galectin-9-like isoform X1 [Labeo rohita]|uniref:Galectin n=1 Tax=Labeo rohita TaxID=84645 RepID=A0A498MSC0_LABRO|nr:galectin-9-like isoform X1 [Labeo rohita]
MKTFHAEYPVHYCDPGRIAGRNEYYSMWMSFARCRQISTNGKPFSEYKHRIPFSWVDKVEVVGKAELSLVAFQYPSPLYAAAPGSFVTIFCSRDTYEVFVNGEKTHTFNHRYSYLEQIDVLDIRGDVHLTFVQP